MSFVCLGGKLQLSKQESFYWIQLVGKVNNLSKEVSGLN